MKKAFLVLCLVATMAAAALVDTPDNIYLRNRLVVELQPNAQDIRISNTNGVLSTGFASFDSLLNTYEAASLYKQFPDCKTVLNYNGKQVDLTRYYILIFKKDVDIEKAYSDFASDSIVSKVEYDSICPVAVTTPDDPYWPQSWHHHQIADHDIDSDYAWDIQKGSPDVLLGVIDTGVDWEHPDLWNRIWSNPGETPDNGIDDDYNGYIDDTMGWDWVTGVSGWSGEDTSGPDNDPMDFNGHGTHCSGIVGAEANNGEGVAGVNWDSRIICLRAGYSGSSMGQEVGYLIMSACASAMTYAANQGATAVNCSWNNNNTGGLGAAADYAIASGVLICVAAGNSNNTSQSYLCTRTEALKVAATDSNDVKASFSSYGWWVNVSAPGVSIISTYRQHYGPHVYNSLSGTSMSTPVCVGIAGLLKAQDMSRTWSDLHPLIRDYADNIDDLNPSYAGQLGQGRVSAWNSLNQYTGVNVTNFAVIGRPESVNLSWSASDTVSFNILRKEGDAFDFVKRSNPQKAGFERINSSPVTGSQTFAFVDSNVKPGNNYNYILEAIDAQGKLSYVGPKSGSPSGLVYSLSLKSVRPNPVRSTSTITYSTGGAFGATVPVKLQLFDMSGRLVKTLVDSSVTAGDHEVSFSSDTATMAPGVYTVRLTSAGQACTTRMVVSR